LGLNVGNHDRVVALAGNPNTGKSTVFNMLTGLRQHTGNWAGKTISRAEGGFHYEGTRYKLVDLPGTYSLLSASPDEDVARDLLLFGRPDVTVLVVDATCLQRNLNLVLQVLQITDRAVVCLNLMDEARAHGIVVNARGLADALGVPVVPCSARKGEGMAELLRELHGVAARTIPVRPHQLEYNVPGLHEAVRELTHRLETAYPSLPHAPWIALRLLENDPRITEAVRSGELAQLHRGGAPENPGRESLCAELLQTSEALRWDLPQNLHDALTEAIYAEASRLADRHVSREGASTRAAWQARWDAWLTGRWTGIPLMALLLGLVLWVTIEGANVPSAFLSDILVGQGWGALRTLTAAWPAWLSGVLVDGAYLTMAWVVSVMLPPMMIFFPLFTLLEDLGYLPRVAFNLDALFHRAGAHGKQSLTMAMGYGCNAAGVVAARIIESPRERLLAIVTNNFSLCNGRWPTQFLLASLFVGAAAPPALAGLAAAGAVFSVAALGMLLSLVCSWILSRTVLRGQPSGFTLELPPFRPPHIWRTLYTSLIDRTLFVLWRALVFAAPSGMAIWLVGNVHIGDQTLARIISDGLDPLGWTMGLTGTILLAYIIAIPANEIVIPSLLMLTTLTSGLTGVGEQGAGVMFTTGDDQIRWILQSGGWTLLTAVCLMLFSLCHNPCSTTIYTIYKETGSWRWTTLSVVLPVCLGFFLCALVAAMSRFFGWA
jgi:ferrous iron transport protein B